jgi:hypothetical protein
MASDDLESLTLAYAGPVSGDSETDSQPIGEVGASTSGAVSLCKCGRGPHPSDPDRCAGGHPWLGAQGPALFVGQNSRLFWEAQAEMREEIEGSILRDAGHTRADAPKALELAAASISQAAVVQQSAFARLIESGGPLTSRGRQRRAFNVWLAATDRLERGLKIVGVRRIPKRMDPMEALRAAVAEANR